MSDTQIQEGARQAQLRLLDRLEGLDLQAIDGPTVRLTLPVYQGGTTRDTRDLRLLRVGEGLRTPAVFAVVYGSGSTVYRRSARVHSTDQLLESIGRPSLSREIFEPFRGLPARLLGWAAERANARAGIAIDADEAYNDRDPFEMLALEREYLVSALEEGSRRWAEGLRGVIYADGHPQAAIEAGRRLSALLIDPALQNRYAGRWFETLVAPEDPYWTFEAGGCGLLALALQRELGGELVTLRVLEGGHPGQIEHVALRVGAHYLDVRGLREGDDLRTSWSQIIDVPAERLGFSPASESELLRHFGARPDEITSLAAHLRATLPEALDALRESR